MGDKESVVTVQKKRGRKPFLTEEQKQHKKEQNKEYMRERYKTVYAPIRDRTKKVQCVCGCIVSETNMCRHVKSKKHLDKIHTNDDLNITTK